MRQCLMLVEEVEEVEEPGNLNPLLALVVLVGQEVQM